MHRLRHRRQFLVGNHWSPYRLGLSLWNDANRATLSDAAVEFAAADKAVLVRDKNSQTTRAWTNGQKIVSFWLNTAALNDADNPVIWSNDHIKIGYDLDTAGGEFYLDNNDINETLERTLLSGFAAGWNHFFLHVTAAGEVRILINETVNVSQAQGMQSTTGEMYFGGDEDGNYSTIKFDTFFLFEPDAGFSDFAGLHAWLYNGGDGRTSAELTVEQAAVWKPVSAYDFSARSSTGVWFDAVGGANLTEEYGDIISPTILNGGFEDWTSGLPDDWTQITGDITQETVILKSGNFALRMNAATTGNAILRTTNVSVVPGRKYKLGAWVYGISGGMSLRLAIGDDMNTGHSAVLGQWTYLERSASAGVTPGVGFRRGATDTHVLIDDVTFQAQDIPLTTGITAGLARAYGTDVGDSVSLWLDRSGEANNLAQTAIVSQPMLVEVSGKKGLRFDGVDDRFLLAESFAKTTGETWTACFVAAPNTLNTSVNTAPLLGGETSYVSLLTTGVSARLNGSGNEGLSSITLTATPMVVVVVRNPTSLQAFVNGAAGSAAVVTNDHHAAGLSLVGQRLTSGGGNFQGLMREILIAPRAISTAERQRIERSLAAKYGITLA
jgi:hypothetical protein